MSIEYTSSAFIAIVGVSTSQLIKTNYEQSEQYKVSGSKIALLEPNFSKK